MFSAEFSVTMLFICRLMLVMSIAPIFYAFRQLSLEKLRKVHSWPTLLLLLVISLQITSSLIVMIKEVDYDDDFKVLGLELEKTDMLVYTTSFTTLITDLESLGIINFLKVLLIWKAQQCREEEQRAYN